MVGAVVPWLLFMCVCVFCGLAAKVSKPSRNARRREKRAMQRVAQENAARKVASGGALDGARAVELRKVTALLAERKLLLHEVCACFVGHS